MNLHDKMTAAKLNRVGRLTLSYSGDADVVTAWDGFETEVMTDEGMAEDVAESIPEP